MNPYPNLIFKLLLSLLVVGLIRPLQAQTTVNFNYTGAPQTWVVPGGVTSIQVEAYGGGGSAGTFGDEQQVGGKITATMAVTAGQTLNIYVGGKGVNGVGGYNGGGTTRVYLNTSYGGGGGATDIRIGGTALGNRVLVAGGAGGSGYGYAAGGAGGGLTGGAGTNYQSPYGTGGGGGTQSAGGAGGNGRDQFERGTAGALGLGGSGLAGSGAGGGGYYGGGSGAEYYNTNTLESFGAGGGGGSSYAASAICTNVQHGRAVAYFNGSLAITYTCTGTVTPTVSVSAHPGNQITTGTSVTFAATPTNGGSEPGYQWKKNNTDITGESNATYITTELVDNDEIICVLTSNAACASPTSATSSAVKMTVYSLNVTPVAAPTTVCAGASVTLSASVAEGTSPYTYTWAAPSGASMSGSANESAVTAMISSTASGVQTFTVTVADSGSPNPVVVSKTVNVTVVGMAITMQPVGSSAVCAGSVVSVPVSASGAITGYQWYKGTTPVASQTTTTLSLPSATTADAGDYQLVIIGACTNLTTTGFSLTVSEVATITQGPVTSSVVCVGVSVSVPVSVTGAGTSYQWYIGSSPIASQTTTTLRLPLSTTVDAGSYSLVVTGGCNSQTSTGFTLTVNSSPTISINPATTLIVGGTSAFLVASGGESYTWNTGATTESLTVTPTSTTVYSVSSTGTNGCVGQATATVSVTCTPPVAQAISATVKSVLGPDNCSVTIDGQGTGSSFVFSGPGGYVFSAVYRKVSTYSPKAAGVKQPGTYSLTASSTNACGQVTTSTITYEVTGTACQ